LASASRISSEPATDSEYTHTDRFHTGPGTLAGRFMRMFWQPVCVSEDLPPGKARPIRIMSEDFTLYRGESGTPHVVAFRCAHRRTQLSVGGVEEDCIRCIYHGWKYDGSGQCVDQPAEPNSWADKVKIASYPTQDYLGIIFVYFGEGEPPPFPRYPEFDNFEGIFKWSYLIRECNLWNNLENSLDHTHIGFVHREAQGSWNGVIDNPVLTVEESQWGITNTATWPSGKQDITQWGMPNILRVIAAPSEPHIVSYNDLVILKVPIDDESHIQFLVIGLHMAPGAPRQFQEQPAKRHVYGPDLGAAVRGGKAQADDFDLSIMDRINLDDDLAQVGQGVIPDQDELLGQTDAGVILVRRLWHRELQALAEGQPLKQWSYDPELLPLRDWRLQ
jgi:5,5'-dehydrodivanillate O-demethylase